MSDVLPQLTDAIRVGVDSARVLMRTATPAKVVSFDANRDMLVVKPMMRAKLRSGDVVELPNIDRVPIVRVGSCGGWMIDSEFIPGDEVLLIISDRDISGWIATGEVSTPGPIRTHALTDAIALAGFVSQPKLPRRRAAKGELIIGRGNGSKPALVMSSTAQSIVAEAIDIKLGNDTATRGVARQNDVVTAATAGSTLLTNISAALTAITAIPANAAAAPAAATVASTLAAGLANLGTISTSSAIVKSV